MDCGLPLFASTIATPVLRREASMASTRIYRNVKIDCDGFNTESTNSKATVLLVRLTNGFDDEQNTESFCRYRSDDVCHACERSKIIRNDKRIEPDRDAGFGTRRRPFVKFSNPGQTYRESVSTSSGVGSDRLG